MTELRQALRAATQAAHCKLEAAFALDPAGLTCERYGWALQVLHAVRSGWEPALVEWLPDTRGPHLAWLEADLRVLRLDPFPPAPSFSIGSEAEAWGVSYVLEGSALGGRSLLRALAPLGFTPERGARYFAGRGKETGPHWSSFLARLEAQATPSAAPVMIRAAQTAFESLYQEARSERTERLSLLP